MTRLFFLCFLLISLVGQAQIPDCNNCQTASLLNGRAGVRSQPTSGPALPRGIAGLELGMAPDTVKAPFVLTVTDDPAAMYLQKFGKTADAKRFGAHEVVVSKDEDAMNARAKTLDFILDTVSAKHDLDAYLNLLKRDGTLCLLGAPPEPVPLGAFSLIRWRHRLAGSLIGGIAETQEMLDFCADRGITCDIEKINIDYVNEAYERVVRSDVKYRFVIDAASLK